MQATNIAADTYAIAKNNSQILMQLKENFNKVMGESMFVKLSKHFSSCKNT